MKRVIVTGCPGSGKSTFSRELQRLTGLPLISLDNIWWKPDRTHISREEFDARLAEILQTDAWILDGSYSRTFEPRIAACDTVILLDYDTDVCMESIRARVGKERADIPWTEQTLDPELVAIVETYKERNNPVLHALFQRYADKDIHIFRTRDEAKEWLETLSPKEDETT